MKQQIYNFKDTVTQTENDIKGEVFRTRDYFEYYHTGIEELPFQNESMYFVTQRYPNERTEVIANLFYEDADLSDTILAMNNDVYWWDAPTDFDTSELIVENKIKMVEDLRKEKLGSHKEFYHDLFTQEVEVQNDIQKKIVIPKFRNLARVNRLIKKYLTNRICI